MVKLTFARGASLADPLGLFNSSLEGNRRRAIDIREGEKLAAEAFKALIQAAVAENLRSSPRSHRAVAGREPGITLEKGQGAPQCLEGRLIERDDRLSANRRKE